jgi:hypothetical protein
MTQMATLKIKELPESNTLDATAKSSVVGGVREAPVGITREPWGPPVLNAGGMPDIPWDGSGNWFL